MSEDSAETDLTIVDWSVPGIPGTEPQHLVARAGEVITIVGANGAGKSALGWWLEQSAGGALIRRVIAHRKLWFEHAGPEISSAQSETTRGYMKNWNSRQDSRYVDRADGQRTSIVLFDLLAALNTQNSRIVELYRSGASTDDVDAAIGQPLLERLNAALGEAGLSIQLELTDHQSFNARNTILGSEYPIFQMSDGEKSALLLAADVLTAPSGCVQIIDEPERHLHRSISAGLIEALITERPDCGFVLITHDLDLASAVRARSGHTYSLTSSFWDGPRVVGWALHAVDAESPIPESARRAILGGRQDVLFIEGDVDSLDLRLYRTLFTEWSLFPAGGAEQVLRAVDGLRSSEEHHWVNAQGLVDGDGRSEEERAALGARGILSLPVSEVESLYYVGDVIDAMAEAQAQALSKSATELRTEAKRRALVALGLEGTLERLTSRLAVAEVRRKAVEQLPIRLGPDDDPIQVTFPSPYRQILLELQARYAAGDLEALTRRLPIRDTPMRSQVASSLGFRSTADYEAAVRVRVSTEPTLATALRDIVGPLPVPAKSEAEARAVVRANQASGD